VNELEPCPATRTLPAEGVVGVSGNELADVGGDPLLVALLRGRNIPAPSIDVVK
jgi:hypothetical protein